MSLDEGEVLDASQVEDLKGIDGGAGEVFGKLVELYLSRTPERLERLRQHLSERDFAKMSVEAHALKGASGNVGAARVARVCARIEQRVAESETQWLEALLDKLESEHSAACTALKAASGAAR